MIIIEVTPPEDESADAKVCVFQASLHRGSRAFDIEDAVPLMQELFESLDLDVTFDEADTSTVTIAYDPSETSWLEWYVNVVDAIMTYVRENFPRYGHEVLSRVVYASVR